MTRSSDGPAEGGVGGARPDRRARLVAHLDLQSGRGLEVGPLYAPVVTKDEGDVSYVDIHFAEGLREFYATHPGTPVDEIIEVDFALIQDGRTRSLAEATAPAAPFDWVVASHVIEHVPDLIGWLQDVAEVLVDGGMLSLAVPDRRYCFDARRPATTVGQMLLAHDNGDERPSVRAVFDHHHLAVRITPEEVWQHGRPGPDRIMFPLQTARDMVARSVVDGTYTDCHVWLFTPRSFVEQLAVLFELGSTDFTVADVVPTAVNDMEFFVSLRRVPRGAAEAARLQLLATGFDPPAGDPASSENSSPAESVVTMALSRKEQRLIEFKRRLLTRLRAPMRPPR